MNIDVLRNVVKNDPPRHLIEELSPDSPTLKEINEAFMEISRDIDILTCFETRKTKTLVRDASTGVYTRSGEAILMLPQSSATGYWPKEKVVHANANHSNIAKLKKGGGSILLNVGMAIKRALVPTAQSFFADPQNTGDADWKDQPMDESEMNDPGGSPYARGSSQSPQSGPWNSTRAQSYFSASGQDSETHQPMSQNMNPEPAHFAQSGGPRSWNTQAQQSPTPPPPYNHPTPPEQFSANQVPGETGFPPSRFKNRPPYESQQSEVNHGPSMPAMNDDQAMRQMFEQMGFNSDAKIQVPQPTTEHEESAADSPSQEPEDTAVGRHPNVYCDECDEEIVVALHPKHQFEAINPPGLNDGDDSTDAGADDDDSDNDDERVGVAEGAYCHADVESPSFFFQCSKCSGLELACQKCQEQPTCMTHNERVQPRHFTWYGNKLASNIWISDEPSPGDSALVQALKRQDMDRLAALAGSQQLVNAIDYAARTPLHIAAHLRLQVCAKFLLMHGANLEIRDRNFCTPLSQAILSKNSDMAFLLLERRANPRTMDIGGNTPLHFASIAGCLNLAAAYIFGNFGNAHIPLKAGADANMTNDNGATQLGELAASDERQAVMFLLNTGAEVDSLDDYSRTALYRAAENGHFGLCNDLLNHGAESNIMVNGGYSTLLGEAASNGHLKTVECLIEGGTEVEGRDITNRSPLFRAAASRQPEVCRALLERGATPNPGLALPDDSDEECQWGMTPLQIAAFFDLDDVAEVLIEYEVLLEETDDWGRTALYLAAERGNIDVCAILLGAGADCDAQANGSSVISIAAQRGHFEMVQLLLQEGATAVPPPSVKGQKWKNFVFDPAVMSGRKQDILELLRANKHR
ncbi:hypothetical protein Daus18300_011664 [Diaporthe australafricana]|uniref:Ankyrin repeat protein n=1 Tax=Diaporthe australafricana TaxID=127596 RepID=A0ABR3W5P1_9PEZI